MKALVCLFTYCFKSLNDSVVLQKLLKEYKENQVKFEDGLKKEQERTKDTLKLKLEERKRKRKQSEMDKMKLAEEGMESQPTERIDEPRSYSMHREGPKSKIPQLGSGMRSIPPPKDGGNVDFTIFL